METKTPHKTKKRRHGDGGGQSASRKKRKGHVPDPDPGPENASGIPAKSPRSGIKPRPPPTSPPPAPATAADLDHDISITDIPEKHDDSKIASSSSSPSSPFYTTTLSLYLNLPAIALSPVTALPSLLTTHLAPLLLTYYPPVRGIVLSISDPVLSSKKPQPDNPPARPRTDDDGGSGGGDTASQTVLAHCADSDGLSYVWLTATFLTFRPEIGDELQGWVNVCSEGFVGLTCYNYFQVAVARNRIPRRWTWSPPGGQAERGGSRSSSSNNKGGKKMKKRGRKQDDDDDEDDEATSQGSFVNGGEGVDDGGYDEHRGAGSGYFRREDGSTVKGSIRFRVVDCELVPGHDRDSWSLQIEGTLLSAEEEDSVLEEERQKAQRRQHQAIMSGGPGL